ncbi:hypothetical protein Pcac1_g22382 [Phytophthora cactorum]|nr:hypothetical protein Pcac1_g22382 [Phytophthora cactorum]
MFAVKSAVHLPSDEQRCAKALIHETRESGVSGAVQDASLDIDKSKSKSGLTIWKKTTRTYHHSFVREQVRNVWCAYRSFRYCHRKEPMQKMKSRAHSFFGRVGVEDRLLGDIYERDQTARFLDGFNKHGEWASWDAFEKQFRIFCAETYQHFPMRTSTKVGYHNAQIKKSKTNVSGFIPEKWFHCCKTDMCTHGHKYVSRDKGIRTHITVRFTGCLAKLNATVPWGGNTRGWYLSAVAKGVHNHEHGLQRSRNSEMPSREDRQKTTTP